MEGSDRTARDFQPTETRWTSERLQAELVDACRREPYKRGIVPFEQLPHVLEVGDAVHAATACVRGSAIDGKERGVSMFYDPLTKKMALEREVRVGDERTVSFISFPSLNETELHRRLRQMPPDRAAFLSHALFALTIMGPEEKLADRLTAILAENTAYGALFREAIPRIVGNVHSHPVPMPVSYVDIATFLSQPSIKQMTVGLSDGRVEMLLKTTDTTVFAENELKQKMEGWRVVLETRVHDASPKNHEQWFDYNFRAQRALARSIAIKHKIGYFAGEPNADLKRIV